MQGIINQGNYACHMNNTQPVIIAYDISDNKKRNAVYKILKKWRLDGQKSVHECRLKQWQAEELFLQINEIIDQDTDCLMIAWLETHRQVLYKGIGKPFINNNLWEWRMQDND
jgi:CRISPR-associated protein Cas2